MKYRQYAMYLGRWRLGEYFMRHSDGKMHEWVALGFWHFYLGPCIGEEE